MAVIVNHSSFPHLPRSVGDLRNIVFSSLYNYITDYILVDMEDHVEKPIGHYKEYRDIGIVVFIYDRNIPNSVYMLMNNNTLMPIAVSDFIMHYVNA